MIVPQSHFDSKNIKNQRPICGRCYDTLGTDNSMIDYVISNWHKCRYGKDLFQLYTEQRFKCRLLNVLPNYSDGKPCIMLCKFKLYHWLENTIGQYEIFSSIIKWSKYFFHMKIFFEHSFRLIHLSKVIFIREDTDKPILKIDVLNVLLKTPILRKC